MVPSVHRPVAAGGHWVAFALVCAAYLGVTVGEQALSPVMPQAASDLGLDTVDAGLAFGVLAGAIAVANLVGGAVLGRIGARRLMLMALGATTLGSVVTASASGFGQVVVGQGLLGAGAGGYFPAGLTAVGVVAGPRRRGFAMGVYGVAFSAGLTIAALLGALGAAGSWRWAFWAAAALAAAAFGATWCLRLAPTPPTPISFRFPVRAVLGMPTYIGTIGAICQYGAVPFLTTFAVQEWGLGAAAAATLLAIGRVISIAAKIVSGASADRVGALVSARRTGAALATTGVAWVLLPAGWPAYACAAVFAGTVSSLFPIANLVALERFGSQGPALGAYRSTQIAAGALAGWGIGGLGAVVGLRPTLLIAVATPTLLVLTVSRSASHAH